MKFRLLAAIVLVVAGIFGEPIWDKLKDIDLTPKPPITVVEPSLEYKTLVKPIIDMEIEGNDSILMSTFFDQLSSVVRNDEQFIKTTGQFRQFNITAGGLNFKNQIKGDYPDLGETIDGIIMQSIGKEDKAMDSKTRTDLSDTLNAISWGVTQ